MWGSPAESLSGHKGRVWVVSRKSGWAGEVGWPTHVESPSPPASAHEAVAAIGLHGEGERLLGEVGGQPWRRWARSSPTSSGAGRGPMGPTWSLSVCTRAAPLTHTGCRAPAILVTSPDLREGLLGVCWRDLGSHYLPAHGGREGKAPWHLEGWNFSSAPVLAAPPCP